MSFLVLLFHLEFLVIHSNAYWWSFIKSHFHYFELIWIHTGFCWFDSINEEFLQLLVSNLNEMTSDWILVTSSKMIICLLVITSWHLILYWRWTPEESFKISLDLLQIHRRRIDFPQSQTQYHHLISIWTFQIQIEW